MAKMNPPHANELELSLFGPGIGECLVVHLGAGNWMVVDSCLNEAGDKAIALEYLEGLGVDVASQVRLIVVTHWHDDHIRGVAKILRYATSARFACPAALKSKEFLTLVVADEDIKLVEHTSGASEFADVLKVLDSRKGGPYRAGPDHWACDGMRLYSETNPCLVEVHALSPSSQAITDTKGDIARQIPVANQVMRRFPGTGPNTLSVVLLVKTDRLHLLLGADLESGRDGRRGWRAVLGSELRPNVASSTYKVAHHGSANADLNDIWRDLLVGSPRAILTPYCRGPKPLPSDEDISRIKTKTDYLYCTAWPPTTSPPRRDRAVQRTMKEMGCFHRATRKRPGHIRVRAPFGGRVDDILVELFDGARRL